MSIKSVTEKEINSVIDVFGTMDFEWEKESSNFKARLDLLDNDDERNCFIKLLENNNNKLIRIDDIKYLKLVAKLSIREICFAQFYFIDYKTIILGNFDLSFPIYSKELNNIEYFRSKAIKNSLFIR